MMTIFRTAITVVLLSIEKPASSMWLATRINRLTIASDRTSKKTPTDEGETIPR